MPLPQSSWWLSIEGLQRGLDRAQALRGAMLAVMAEHPQPRDWAAFVVLGDRGHTDQRSL
ncbi:MULTISPECIES: CHAT domain-containing protein [Cyanophyceae]|uniref:CHAT domain-containing protein n=1 Tax=Cyanophyceae TaxID=3028117 RepID=UPI002410D400|nr:MULTISPECIES: CHAT domain-containing protein [Cyanophyceae]